MQYILQKRSLVTVNILYWMPDYNNIVQEFYWQTCDVQPDYPRVNRFLLFWKNEIDAVIKEINLLDHNGHTFRNAVQIEELMNNYGKLN